MSVTKCKGYGCPFAKNCERVVIREPLHGERWFRGVPFSDDEGLIECNHYLDKDETAMKLMERLQNDS